MSVQQALALYAEVLQDQPHISLSNFARDVEVPYWKLRDARRYARRAKVRQARCESHRDQVRDVALANPTYGYRRVQHQLVRQYGQAAPGRHEVRRLLRELDLIPAQPRKIRRPSVPVLTPLLWPEGRRIQIDATRFSLADGVAWVYVVLDVQSRAVLHLEVVRHLSASSAVTALQTGLQMLHHHGIGDNIVVMSDGGSDFTSQAFKLACDEVGCWIRAKVSQRGGMGILERVNRNLKYEWIFRQEVRSITELRVQCAQFQHWNNTERLHSALGYTYPWDKLVASAKSLFAA
ncbi:integrase core domain-containing protein [Deinococcus marmoris]|uniref:integrase core domain-containing protein n=1 Tax=Deinococcus marmoris TaxID=249408 RepID=UPI00068AF325|nr:integrase core domain-containing protein [Deinococcus marmoris]